jgi:uncharacterized repeat protein (TIGR01451 family)
MQRITININRGLLAIVCSLCCIMAFAQEGIYYDAEIKPNSARIGILPGTQFVDRWGYPWVNTKSKNNLAGKILYNCSVFNLEFGDVNNATGKGFDDPTFVSLPGGHPLGVSTTLGALRRWTACQVFDYISSVIIIPGGQVPDVYFDVSELDGTGALAYATPFFSTTSPSFQGGLLNQHIVTGVDPTPNPGDFDAKITCDFGPNNSWPFNGTNLPFNSDAFVTNGQGLDLFSILLHEATHALGFFSSVGSNGNSSVTNSSPGVYSLFDRYILNASSINLVNGSFAFQGSVPDLTSNALTYFKSTNSKSYSIYSPSVWKDGSSLSHFDETRDNEQYLMGPMYSGGLRRAYVKAELEALCNLGYSLNVAGFSCADRYAVGVNDFATAPSLTGSVTKDVILNDYDPDGQPIALDPAIILLTNAGTATVIGNSIQFTPNGTYAGNVMIRYRPYTTTNGYTGSYATLTVTVPSPGFCPLDPCNLVCNGGFEEGLTLPQFETIVSQDMFRTVQNGGAPGWNNASQFGTADAFFRGSQITGPNSYPVVGIPISFFGNGGPPGIETPTSPNNNRYVGMYQGKNGSSGCQNTEGVWRNLVQPLVIGETYQLSYAARAVCYAVPCNDAYMNTSFSVASPTFSLCQNFNGTYLNTAAIARANSNVTGPWTNVSYTFTATQNSQFVVFESIISTQNLNPNASGPYIFVDNVRLEKVGNQISTSVTSSTPNPKIGQNVTFTIQVCNTSASPVNNVTVTNLLPTGFTLVNSTFSAYPNHTFSSLAAGQCVNLTVTAQADPSVAVNTDLQNCAGVTSANACNQAQACAAVRVLATDISVDAAQQSCNAFRVTITNLGSVAAHNLNLNYTPPSCFGYASYTVISGSASYAPNQISIPLLPANSAVVIEFTGGSAVANCVNTVSLTAAFDEWDINLNNNTGTMTMSPTGCSGGPCINLPRIQ